MSYSIIMGIVRLLIRAVTFWNNILAESGKSPAEQLFGVKLRSKADDFIRLTQKEGIICVRKNLKWNVRD